MNTKKNSKVLALLLALAMVFVMSVPAFATDTDPNMTMVNFAQARTSFQKNSIDDNTEVLLKATSADAGYNMTSFDTENAAKGVAWTSSDSQMATVKSVTAIPAPNGGYYSQAAVQVKNLSSGSCTVEARKGNAYVNFTIVVEDNNNVSVASGITIRVHNTVNGDLDVIENEIVASLPTSGEILSKTDRATTFSTPLYALYKIVKPANSYDPNLESFNYITDIELGSWGTYVDTIKGDVLENGTVVNRTYSPYTSASYEYYGWNYRVVRNGEVVASSKVIGAADFKLMDNDEVYWVFGTPESTDSYVQSL